MKIVFHVESTVICPSLFIGHVSSFSIWACYV